MGFKEIYLQSKPRLILFCGLPGSGKTTLAHQFENDQPVIRLCPDEWMASLGIDLFDEAVRARLETQLWELGKKLLCQGQTVVLENGLWSRAERDDKRYDAEKLGVHTELHYFNVPFEELIRRLEIRNTSGSNATVPLTRTHMERYAKLFQAPDATELALFTKAIVHKAEDRNQRSAGSGNFNHEPYCTIKPMNAVQSISANEIVEDFLATLKSRLKLDLVGVYLYGSLVSGDFKEQTSDIDLLIVINTEVDSTILESLNALHDNFFANHESWRARFDVAYVSKDALWNFKSQPSKVIVGSGDDPLEIVEAPEYYLIDWYKVQKQSLDLYGPKATELIPHISTQEFSQVIYTYMQSWRDKVKDAKNRGAQSYIILTICRSAYAYKFAKHVSKRTGAEWAQSEYPQWSELIDTALSWSRLDEKDDIMDEPFHKQTVEFVRFMVDAITVPKQTEKNP